MKRVLVVILIIILIVVGFLFVVPFLLGSGLNANLQVVWLDENGNPVGGLGFVNPAGDPVASVQTDVSFTVIGSSGGDVDAPQVSGTLTITVKLNTYTGGIVNTITESFLWTGKLTGSWTHEYSVDSLIGTPEQIGKDNGWVVTFVLELEAIGYIDDNKQTATDTASVAYGVKWSSETLLVTGVVAVVGG